MAKKKVSDTIEQQRKARAEFLKLKQMQNGEIAPEPKPSEVAVLPKTPKEKIANFWFQYKTVLIVSVFLFAVLTILVVQCTNKVESDLDIVYFSYTTCLDTEIEQMEEYFEQYVEDLNSDGEVTVNIINCSYSPEESNLEYKNTMLQKLQATLVANSKAMLYITDTESIKYFDNVNNELGFFDGEPVPLTEELYAKLDSSEFGEYLPRDLQISVRSIDGTIIEKEESAKENLAVSKELLDNLAN